MKTKQMKIKTIFKQSLFLFGMAIVTNTSVAQDAVIDGIKAFEGAGDVEKNGYYNVYQAEGEKGKYRNYTIDFLDYEYNALGKEKIQLSKKAYVIDSETNDSHLAIAFGDLKEKKLIIRTFNRNGKSVGALERDFKGFASVKMYKSPEGFVVVNEVRKSAMARELSYEIIGVDNELNELWTKNFDEGKALAVVDILASEDGVAIVYTSGKGMKMENYDQNLMRLSNMGVVEFDKTFANNYYYFPNRILLDEEKTLIFGSYPEEGKSKTKGVYGIAFSYDGEVIIRKEVDFEKDITPVVRDLMTEEQLNMKESPQFIVNDVIKTDDAFYVITETVRLRPSLGGSVNVSTGGGAGGSITMNTAFIMGDFIVLKFDLDLELANIKFVTKEENKIVVSGVVVNVNQYYQMLKAENISNYQFCVENKDGNPAMVYTILEGYRNNVRVGIADITTEELITKSEPIASEMGRVKKVEAYGVLKNEPGKLSVFLYKGKEISYYSLNY